MKKIVISLVAWLAFAGSALAQQTIPGQSISYSGPSFPSGTVISTQYLNYNILYPGNTGSNDQTTNINAAMTTCAAQGKGLYFPAGVYQYSNPVTIKCPILGEGNFSTQMQYTVANGTTSYWVASGLNNWSAKGIYWSQPSTTYDVGGTGPSALIVTHATNFEISGNQFSGIGGSALLVYSSQNGTVTNNIAQNLYHDAFDFFDGDADIVVTNNQVINGWDDAFAVWGQNTAAKGVRPQRITFAYNKISTVQYAHGFSILGGKDIIIADNSIYNTINSAIFSDPGGYNAFGSENVDVHDNIIDNCGAGVGALAPSTSGSAIVPTANASNQYTIYLKGNTAQPHNNYNVHDNHIVNSPTGAIYLTTQGNNMQVRNNTIVNDYDPTNKNGVKRSMAATATFSTTITLDSTTGLGYGMSLWWSGQSWGGTPPVAVGAYPTIVSISGNTVTLSSAVSITSGTIVYFYSIPTAVNTTLTSAYSSGTTLSVASTTGITTGMLVVMGATSTQNYQNYVVSTGTGTVTISSAITTGTLGSFPIGSAVSFVNYGGGNWRNISATTTASTSTSSNVLTFYSTNNQPINTPNSGATGYTYSQNGTEQMSGIYIGMSLQGSTWSAATNWVVTGLTATTATLSANVPSTVNSGTTLVFGGLTNSIAPIGAGINQLSGGTSGTNTITFAAGSLINNTGGWAASVGMGVSDGAEGYIPAGTFITAVNTSTATITMSNNTTNSIAGSTPIYFYTGNQGNYGAINLFNQNNPVVEGNVGDTIAEGLIYIDSTNQGVVKVLNNHGTNIGTGWSYGRFIAEPSAGTALSNNGILQLGGNTMLLPDNVYGSTDFPLRPNNNASIYWGQNWIGPINLASTQFLPGNFAENNFVTLAQTNYVYSAVVPAISSGFGTGDAISVTNGTAAFYDTVGSTPSTALTLTMPAAPHGWSCPSAVDVTTPAIYVAQTGLGTSTSAVFTSYTRTTGVAGAPTASDKIVFSCTPY